MQPYGLRPGGGPAVQVYDVRTGALLQSFFAYDPSFRSGVNVGSGDVNGDGFSDIVTGAGSGGGPHVKVLSGKDGTTLFSFFAYDPSFTGGVRVAAGDVNGGGKADIITGAGGGGSAHVKVFDGANLNVIYSLFAYDFGLRDGVFVAAGDVDGDGFSDILTGAGGGGSAHVKVFSGTNAGEIRSFFAFPSNGRDGVSVGAVDRNNDGKSEILAGSGMNVPAQIKVFNPTNSQEESAFTDVSFTGGVYVG